MKSVLKFLLGVAELAIIIFAICMVSILFLQNKYGYTVYGDDTLIMIDDESIVDLPNFNLGDLVIVNKVVYDDVEIGDELYYYDVIKTDEEVKYIVKTGIVKTKSGENRSALYTFEDNEKLSIAGDRIIGKYKKTYPKYGKIISFLTSTVGFLIFVILPILILFIYHVYHLIIVLKYDK